MKVFPPRRRLYLLLTATIAVMIPAFLFGRGDPLDVGTPAPRLTVTIETGESIDLGSFYDQGPVLIYFYPKSDTPGCTRQACNLRDHFAELQDAGLTVFGVSTDSVEAQRRFRDNHNLPFSLIADTERELGKAFGVGNAFMGFFSRQSFLVIDGKIAWRDLSASPASQAQDALAAFRNTAAE